MSTLKNHHRVNLHRYIYKQNPAYLQVNKIYKYIPKLYISHLAFDCFATCYMRVACPTVESVLVFILVLSVMVESEDQFSIIRQMFE